jgi:hypothetical protein
VSTMQAAHTPDGEQAGPTDGRTEAGPSGLQHAAMPYRRVDELAAGVTSFVQAARAGGSVLIAAAAANLRFLRERLHAVDGQVAWADISSAGLNPRPERVVEPGRPTVGHADPAITGDGHTAARFRSSWSSARTISPSASATLRCRSSVECGQTMAARLVL